MEPIEPTNSLQSVENPVTPVNPEAPAPTFKEETKESPLVEASFRIDAASQRLYYRRLRAVSVALTVFGAVFVVAFIVFFTLNGETLGGKLFRVPAFLLYILLFFGAVPLGVGIGYFFLMKKNVATAERTNSENHYKFYPDFVLISVTKSGENLGEVKTYYSTFSKIRENKKYFLLYPTISTVYPVLKSDLTEEEQISLRSVLPLRK